MSTEFNNRFRSTAQYIVRRYLLTSVRYPAQSSGLTVFDLNHHFVNNNVVTLDAPERSYPMVGFMVRKFD